MLTVDDLQSLMACGRTTAYARTREPGFPDPVVFSGSSYRWWRHEVLEWVEAQRANPRRVRPAAARVPVERVDAPLPVPRPVQRRRAGGEAA